MKEIERRRLLPALCITLSACGQYLGDYAVENVTAAANVPPLEDGGPSPPYKRYLDIRVASRTDLTSLREGAALFVDADSCPIRNDRGLIAFGPFSDRWVDFRASMDVKRLRAGTDGRFRYHFFVVVSNEAQQVTEAGQLQLPTYDLKKDTRDVCLRLFSPGYNLTKSRSQVIRVPAEDIANALAQVVGQTTK